MNRIVVALLAFFLLRADMFQDGSNATQPGALNNITKAAGSFHAPAYGSCTWDATHDVGACINQAITAAAQAGGGTVTIPAGTFGVSTPIATAKNNIGINCNAPSGSKDAYAASATTGCELKWIGAAGGRIMSFASATGAESIVGVTVKNIRFNGNAGLAKDGLYIQGMNGGIFNGLRFTGGFNGGAVISLDIPHTEHTPLAIGTQHNHFSDTAVYNTGHTSTGLYLGYYQSATGNPANASGNYFTGTQIQSSGKGIHCHGCDLNLFLHTFVTTAGEPSVDLDVYTDNGRAFGANHNTFINIGWLTHPPLARGTATRPTCTPMNYATSNFGTCSWGNAFISIDGQNGSQPPTVETGAFARWDMDFGVSTNMNSLSQGDGKRPNQTLMKEYAYTNFCAPDAMAYGAGTGHYYCGRGWYPMMFSNGDAAPTRFSAGLDTVATAGTENLRWNRPAGTGSYEFADAPIKTATTTVGALPTCNAGRKGAAMSVSDQSGVPTWRGALTGGGALAVLAYCNGATWEAH